MKNLFKKTPKEAWSFLNDQIVKLYCDIQSGKPVTNKGDRTAVCTSAVATVFLARTCTSLAATPSLFAKAQELLNEYYGYFFALATGIAVLITLIGFLIVMISYNGKSAEKGWGWVKRVWLCWIVINVLGGILALAQGLTEGQNYEV